MNKILEITLNENDGLNITIDGTPIDILRGIGSIIREMSNDLDIDVDALMTYIEVIVLSEDINGSDIDGNN